MKIKITEELVDYLHRSRVYLRPHFHYENALNKVVHISNSVIVESYSRVSEQSLNWDKNAKIGAFSYVVPGSYLAGCEIGRFCSIAANVQVMGENHPVDRVTTSTWSYGHNVAKIVEEDFGVNIKQNRNILPSNQTIIGNDVWIGEGVVIKRGVNIGNGAIVGARSIVTKDIPPYAICAGNPAKLVRFRFSDDEIKKIESVKWWNYHPKDLAPLDMSDVSEFLDGCSSITAQGFVYPDFDLKAVFLKYGEEV